jgi:hypothetical protein
MVQGYPGKMVSTKKHPPAFALNMTPSIVNGFRGELI